MSAPYWLQDSIFYQIFPDRFAIGDVDPSHPPLYTYSNLQAWGTPPTQCGFQGGNLRGILQRLDYLLDLGVNALYLNPIFLSPSNHRYNTSDYYTIDPRLGNLADFHTLVDALHANGMRLVLDGVFNHCSRGFFAFADLLENEAESIYRDWFHVTRFPLSAYTRGKAKNYAAWWGFKSLPKFNTNTPAVRCYILDVARYWIEQGADGWRLDVPNEIDDDTFWAEFRQAVHNANPDAGLIGEIWTTDPRWVSEGHFDSLMNYPLRAAILGLLMPPGTPVSGPPISPLNLSQFAGRMEELLALYPRDNVYAMYNLLGSHDTERLRTLLDNDLDKLKLAYALLFAFPGAPSVYYGDEIGLAGGRDPACRAAFPWQPDSWLYELRAWVQRLIDARKRLPALRRGGYQRLLLDENRDCYAFARTLGEQSIVVALNATSKPQRVSIPLGELGRNEGRTLRSLLTEKQTYRITQQAIHIRLPAWGIAWIE